MPLHIRSARTPIEKDALYRFRYMLKAAQPVAVPPEAALVFGLDLEVEETEAERRPVIESLMDGIIDVDRICDRFDAFPTSRSFIAQDGVELVGVLRVSLDSPVGMPNDLLKARDAADRPALVDQFYLDPDMGAFNPAQFGLLKLAFRWARRRGASRLCLSAPPVAPQILREIGFSLELDTALWTVDIDALRASFAEPTYDPMLDRLIEDCDRSVYRRGDYLFRRGGVADTLFVVARGRVLLQGQNASGEPVTIAVVGPGELLGEEISGGPSALRWVDARVDAQEADVWTRSAVGFQAQIETDGELRRAFYHSMATRIQALTGLLAGKRPLSLRRMLVDILRDLAARSSSSDGSGPIPLGGCTPVWLAEKLGCRPNLLEEELKTLELEGIISLEGERVVILDRNALENPRE